MDISQRNQNIKNKYEQNYSSNIININSQTTIWQMNFRYFPVMKHRSEVSKYY